jgi:spore maturation protein CgeB
MNIVIFGLTISSAWGNGHATLWRALCRALARRGHHVTFFEQNFPYYAQHRDESQPAGYSLILYDCWKNVRGDAMQALKNADVGMVTSYCPDGRDAAATVFESDVPFKVFYDLDTPVTIDKLARGEDVEYLPTEGLGGFDLVLSYTGGPALEALRKHLGAQQVAALYGSVDPDHHFPVLVDASRRCDLSYLGTYALDRQSVLEALFIEPSRRRPDLRFMLAGSQYPGDFPWTPNIFYKWHMPPGEHPCFFSSSAMTLNVTRAAIAAMGYCPSGRLFEAAACATTVLSNWWEGLDHFFEPGCEILIAQTTDDVVDALDMDFAERRKIGIAARERVLDCHTAHHRAADLEFLLERAAGRQLAAEPAPDDRASANAGDVW